MDRLQGFVEASRREATAQLSVFEKQAISDRQAEVSAAVQEAESRGRKAVQGVEVALQAKEAELEVEQHPLILPTLLSSQ